MILFSCCIFLEKSWVHNTTQQLLVLGTQHQLMKLWMLVVGYTTTNCTKVGCWVHNNQQISDVVLCCVGSCWYNPCLVILNQSEELVVCIMIENVFTNYFWAHHIIVRLRTPLALLIPKGISAYYLIPLLSYPVRKDCRYCQIAEPCTFLFSTEATLSMLTNC